MFLSLSELQADALKKRLDERHTSELGEPHIIEGHTQLSRSSGHCCPTLTFSEVSQQRAEQPPSWTTKSFFPLFFMRITHDSVKFVINFDLQLANITVRKQLSALKRKSRSEPLCPSGCNQIYVLRTPRPPRSGPRDRRRGDNLLQILY